MGRGGTMKPGGAVDFLRIGELDREADEGDLGLVGLEGMVLYICLKAALNSVCGTVQPETLLSRSNPYWGVWRLRSVPTSIQWHIL